MAIRLVVSADGLPDLRLLQHGTWLLLAGLALVPLAGVRLVRASGRRTTTELIARMPPRPRTPRGVAAARGPLLAVVLIDPPPLGSFTARRAPQRPQEVSSNSGLDPLPAPRGGAVDLAWTRSPSAPCTTKGSGCAAHPSFWSASPAPIWAAQRVPAHPIRPRRRAADVSPVQVDPGADPRPVADQWFEGRSTWRPGTRLIEGADVAGVRAHRLGASGDPPTPTSKADEPSVCQRNVEAVDDGGGELGALDLGGAFHEAGEVVGDDLVGDGGLEGPDDVVGGLVPAQVLDIITPDSITDRG